MQIQVNKRAKKGKMKKMMMIRCFINFVKKTTLEYMSLVILTEYIISKKN